MEDFENIHSRMIAKALRISIQRGDPHTQRAWSCRISLCTISAMWGKILNWKSGTALQTWLVHAMEFTGTLRTRRPDACLSCITGHWRKYLIISISQYGRIFNFTNTCFPRNLVRSHLIPGESFTGKTRWLSTKHVSGLPYKASLWLPDLHEFDLWDNRIFPTELFFCRAIAVKAIYPLRVLSLRIKHDNFKTDD